jgi:hypothetical protein
MGLCPCLHHVGPLLRTGRINLENGETLVFPDTNTQKGNAAGFMDEILKLDLLPPAWESKLVY